MARYAAVENGIVTNIVVYDGVTKTGYSAQLVPIDDQLVSIGDRYLGGIFYIRPRDGYEYQFIENQGWELTEAAEAEKVAAAVAAAANQRQSLISQAQDSVSVLQLKLLSGRKLTNEESARLNIVMAFIDEVEAIDPENPPAEWPVLQTGQA